MSLIPTKQSRILVLVVACLVGAVLLLKVARPASAQVAPDVAHLAGPWQATLLWSGSGCGDMSGLVNFTLDKTGATDAAVLTTHSGCGDSTLTGQTFVIQTLEPNGSGTANLSCGTGCGWNLNIQVSRNGQMFNLVDVSPANPGNYVAGTAIRQ